MVCSSLRAPIARRWRRVGSALLACISCAIAAAVMPSLASAADGQTCEATALIMEAEPDLPIVNANPPNNPCLADEAGGDLGPLPGGGSVQVAHAKTDLFDDLRTPTAEKEAVAEAEIGGLNTMLPIIGEFSAGLLRTRTEAICDPLNDNQGGTSPGSYSEVENVQVGGRTFTGRDPQAIPLRFNDIEVGTLYLNYAENNGTETIRRAVFLDMVMIPDLIYAESRSGCAPAS